MPKIWGFKAKKGLSFLQGLLNYKETVETRELVRFQFQGKLNNKAFSDFDIIFERSAKVLMTEGGL